MLKVGDKVRIQSTDHFVVNQGANGKVGEVYDAYSPENKPYAVLVRIDEEREQDQGEGWEIALFEHEVEVING